MARPARARALGPAPVAERAEGEVRGLLASLRGTWPDVPPVCAWCGAPMQSEPCGWVCRTHGLALVPLGGAEGVELAAWLRRRRAGGGA